MKRAPARYFGMAGISVGCVVALAVVLMDDFNRGAPMWSAGITVVLMVWNAHLAGEMIGRGLEADR